MFHQIDHSRRGSALVLTSVIIITIAGMAMAMTELTINRFKEQRYRQSQVDLLAATESAANESINWIKRYTAVHDELGKLSVSEPGYPSATTSTSAVLVSSKLPSGLPEVYPALLEQYSVSYDESGGKTVKTNSGYAANEGNRRNSCMVETKVIKVASSATPSIWDGSERFIVYTTAMFGDPDNPGSVRRQRVEAVITALSKTSFEDMPIETVSPGRPFTRGLFAENGFDMKGTAETDSWNSDSNGDGIADTPYKKPLTYTIGGGPGTNSNGDIGSNQTLGAGAYDTSKVHGKATANAKEPTINFTYDPPTSGYISVPALSANQTLTGSAAKPETIFRTSSGDLKFSNSLTIDGSGTVVL
jgi:hypothetical protein